MGRKLHIPRDKFQVIILLLYGVYSYVTVLNSTMLSISLVMKIVNWGTLMAEIFLICSRDYRRKSISMKTLFCILVLGLFFIASLVTDRNYLVVYAAFIFLGQYCDFDNVVKTCLVAMLMSLLTIFGLIQIGILEDYIFSSGDGTRIAHCLGFSYYSTVPFIVLYCMIMYLYFRGEKTRLFEYVILFFINCYLFKLSTLRLTFFLTILLLALNLLIYKTRWINIGNIFVLVISQLLFPIGTIISFYAMKYYKAEGIWLALDKIFSGRLHLMNKGFNIYNIRMLGNLIEMHGNSVYNYDYEYFYIDSGFAYSLLGYGLLFTILVVSLYSFMFRYACKNNNKSIYIWLLVVWGFTMVNNTWVTLCYNPILMFSLFAIKELRGDGGRKISANRVAVIQV